MFTASYLGVPFIAGKKGREAYSFIIDKVKKRLTGWKAKTLSMAGRVTLAQSCIMSIPNYVMQSNCLPASICDEVEQLCRNFIWGSTAEVRKCHLVSWDTVCRSKEDGGLGFRSLRSVNASYMMELGWELITNREALWVKVVRGKYNCGNLIFLTMKCGSKASHIWRGIIKYWSLVGQNIF